MACMTNSDCDTGRNTCENRAGGSRSVSSDMSGGYVTIPSSDQEINTNTVANSVSPDR